MDEVFDAVHNSDKLSGYFTTGGASAPLENAPFTAEQVASDAKIFQDGGGWTMILSDLKSQRNGLADVLEGRVERELIVRPT